MARLRSGRCRYVAVALAVSVWGCSEASDGGPLAPVDSGVVGPSADASVTDANAGGMDAEAPADDAGELLDVGEIPDATDMPDAGDMPDASDTPDASDMPDAGDMPDASDLPDTGDMLDAGMTASDSGAPSTDGGVRPPGALVSSFVMDVDSELPIAGAQVVYFTLDGVVIETTTSAADGSFTLRLGQADVPHMIQVSAVGYATHAAGVVPPDQMLYQFGLLPDAEADLFVEDLNTTRTPGKGYVVMLVETPNDLGGESASITAAAESTVVLNASEDPVAGNTLLPNAVDKIIVFANVDPGLFTAIVSGPAGWTCETLPGDTDQFLVFADTFTDIEVECQMGAPTMTSMINSNVIDADTRAAVPGALVVVEELDGTRVGTATAAMDGSFEVTGLPVRRTLMMHVSAPNFAGYSRPLRLPDGPLAVIELFGDQFANDTFVDSGATRMLDKGVVFVLFVAPNMSGGESATLSAMSGGSFVFDSAGNRMPGAALPPMSQNPSINFLNVDAGLTTLNVTGPGSTCTPFGLPNGGQFRVYRDTFTEVFVECL